MLPLDLALPQPLCEHPAHATASAWPQGGQLERTVGFLPLAVDNCSSGRSLHLCQVTCCPTWRRCAGRLWRSSWRLSSKQSSSKRLPHPPLSKPSLCLRSRASTLLSPPCRAAISMPHRPKSNSTSLALCPMSLSRRHTLAVHTSILRAEARAPAQILSSLQRLRPSGLPVQTLSRMPIPQGRQRLHRGPLPSYRGRLHLPPPAMQRRSPFALPSQTLHRHPLSRPKTLHRPHHLGTTILSTILLLLIPRRPSPDPEPLRIYT